MATVAGFGLIVLGLSKI